MVGDAGAGVTQPLSLHPLFFLQEVHVTIMALSKLFDLSIMAWLLVASMILFLGMGGLMILADSHCHLNMLAVTASNGGIEAYLARARANGIKYLLNVCVNMQDFPAVLAVAATEPWIGASVGVHPETPEADPSLATLIAAAALPEVVAVGETGLDYYHNAANSQAQQQRFRLHIRAALAVNKPLIVHSRNAKLDTIRLLQEENAAAVGGVLHCFTEDWQLASAVLALGFYISLAGIVSFRNAANIQELAQTLPLERLLIETDAPYLAPVPCRGRPNEPAYLIHTAKVIAKLRNIPLAALAAATTANYLQLFYHDAGRAAC